MTCVKSAFQFAIASEFDEDHLVKAQAHKIERFIHGRGGGVIRIGHVCPTWGCFLLCRVNKAIQT